MNHPSSNLPSNLSLRLKTYQTRYREASDLMTAYEQTIDSVIQAIKEKDALKYYNPFKLEDILKIFHEDAKLAAYLWGRRDEMLQCLPDKNENTDKTKDKPSGTESSSPITVDQTVFLMGPMGIEWLSNTFKLIKSRSANDPNWHHYNDINDEPVEAPNKNNKNKAQQNKKNATNASNKKKEEKQHVHILPEVPSMQDMDKYLNELIEWADNNLKECNPVLYKDVRSAVVRYGINTVAVLVQPARTSHDEL